jgi:uncharacterized repeat protein (TIGR02543 family)
LKKPIKFILLLAAGITSLASCGPLPSVETYEVLYLHKDIESAEVMADNFNLKLIDYTAYGVTTYQTSSFTQYQSLLATLGFAANEQFDYDYDSSEIMTSDEYIRDQYALTYTGIADAWSITEGSPDVVIAVIDTGIDIDHPELISSMASTGFDAVSSQEGLAFADDDRGHGTRVAGVIAADKDNNIGIAGAAPNVTILPIKANYPGTTSFRDSYVINGILYAIEQEVDIINLSIGNTSYNALMAQAVQQAEAAGILVVAASGNTGKQQYIYPAAYQHSLSVGSVSDTMNKSFFTTFNDKLDLMAPGHNIITTDRNGYYAMVSGTSFASPYVAAMAAMIKSVYPSMTPADLKERLIESAIDAGEVGYDVEYGHGIANVYQALMSDMATVSFNAMGGTSSTPINVVPGSTIILPEQPLKEHYTFSGWYRDTQYTVPFVEATPIESSMILYAKWTPRTYTIAYYDEVKINSEDIVYGTTASSTPVLTKQGYTFSGWYTYGGQLYDFSKTPTSDVELYARWSIQSYSIIYLNEDGSVYQQMTYTFGTDLSGHAHPDGPLKTYYDFSGWSGVIPSAMPSENIILTPEYIKRIGVIYVVITITIVYEDGSEDIKTIEVPQDEVDDIIEQYGEENVSTI